MVPREHLSGGLFARWQLLGPLFVININSRFTSGQERWHGHGVTPTSLAMARSLHRGTPGYINIWVDKPFQHRPYRDYFEFVTFTGTIIHSDAAGSGEAWEDPQHAALLGQSRQCSSLQQPHGELRDWCLECYIYFSAMLDRVSLYKVLRVLSIANTNLKHPIIPGSNHYNDDYNDVPRHISHSHPFSIF